MIKIFDHSDNAIKLNCSKALYYKVGLSLYYFGFSFVKIMRATENVVYMVHSDGSRLWTLQKDRNLALRELSSIVIGFSFDCAVVYLEHI